MSNIPRPQSYASFLGSQIGAFVSKTGIARLKIANPILSIFEATAQSQLRTSANIFTMLSSINLDNATGAALVKIGTDENVPKITARAATSYVTISDESFEKISSQVYQGTAAPIAGSTSINIVDADDFPASGSIYIGRNTQNFEGPLSYSAKVDNSSYWTLTLSSPSVKFHNVGESVVLAQGGNRTASAGTVVQTPQGSTVQSVQYKTLYAAIIPDGEVSVENVFVTALRIGTVGNVDANAISQFVSDPFEGAVVTNPNIVSNGVDTEKDPEYRERIRVARQTRALGTKLAIKNAAVNTFSVAENKSVISSSYVTRIGEPDVLYIDDGTGYEELPVSVNYDTIIANAVGGEQYINVNSPTPISKAFLLTTLSAPFDLRDGSSLLVIVGNEFTEHFFDIDDFKNIDAASAYEVSSSINGDSSLLFSARTAENGTKVAIFAKQSTFERIQVVESDNDANENLGFPLNIADTLKLYKNDHLLTKDGAPAALLSNPFGSWQTLSGTETLEIAIDGTPALTYTFTDSDFEDGDTNFSTLGNNDLAAWIVVINNKIPGITASAVGSKIQLTSNIGNSARASLDISGGTLVTNGMFEVEDVEGLNNDYQFDRNIGQIKLSEILEAGDTLTAGSANTRAFVESDELTTVDLADDAKLWFGLDGDYQLVNTQVSGSSILDVEYSTNTNPWAYTIRMTSSGSVFDEVEIGDQMIAWDSSFDESLQDSWRVVNQDPTWVEIEKTNCYARRAKAASCLLGDGRVLVCGGTPGGNSDVGLSSAEIYDPVENTWAPVASMSKARYLHTATLLADDTVLVVGGYNSEWDDDALAIIQVATDVCEIYDPSNDTWTTVTPITVARAGHLGVLLTVGPNADSVLVAGGEDGATHFATAYLYDPVGNSWSATGSMAAAKSLGGYCELGDGDVLVAGGKSAVSTASNTSALYDPTAGTWSAPGAISVARYGCNMVWNAAQGNAELVGGYTNFATSPTASTALDRYSMGGGTWSAGTSANFSITPSAWVLCTDGNIVSVSGNSSDVRTQIYDPSGDSWTNGAQIPAEYNYAWFGGYEVDANVVLVSHGQRVNQTDLSITYSESAAVSFLYDEDADAWGYTDASIDLVTLADGGLVFVRNPYPAIVSEISAANDYTATSLASALNEDLIGATAATYKTNQVRVRTNTHDIDRGGIGLITANVSGELIQIDPSDEIENLVGHIGSVESGVGELDVPYWAGLEVIGSSEDSMDLSWQKTETLDPSLNVAFGSTNNNENNLSNDVNYSYGQRRWEYSQIERPWDLASSSFILRDSPVNIVPGESFTLMYPYKFSAYDTLSVLVDNDLISKNYNINMWRTLTTQGTTYANTNTLVDGDNSDESLAKAFGYGSDSFNFEDFVVHMPPRCKTFPGTAAKSILYRFRKLGPDGDNTLLEYVLPDGPDSELSQQVVIDGVGFNSRNLVQLVLPSGAAVEGIAMTGATKIGYANTSNVSGLSELIYCTGLAVTAGVIAAGVATLTLSLPGSITDCGIDAGDFIYFSGAIGFTSGLYAVTSSTASTISYTAIDPDIGAGAISATISMDIQTATFAGSSPAVVANQLFRVDSDSELDAEFTDVTIRIDTTGDQYVLGFVRDPEGDIPVSTTLTWNKIVDPDFFSIFENGAMTAGDIATAFDEGTIEEGFPVSATLLGDGSGTIDQSTAEEEGDGSFYYELTDGINYIKSVTTPATVLDDYIFTFKNSITSSLATGSDWANETVRIVPVTTQNCVDWFSAQGVTGLGTVATIERSSSHQKVQISTNSIGSQGSVQVLGGSANATQVQCYGDPEHSDYIADEKDNWFALRVKTEAAKNLVAGSKVLVQNTKTVSRPGPWAAGSGTIDISAPNGLVMVDNDLFNGAVTRTEGSGIGIQKLNSDYAVVHNFTGTDGGWIYIDTPKTGTPEVSDANKGLFRVVRALVDENCTIIQNANAPEEFNVAAGLVDIKDFNELALPNDYFSFNTDELGDTNIGKRQILSVGKAYVSLAPGSMTRSGATVTVTCPYAHGLTALDSFTISPGEANFSAGTFAIASIIDDTQFTYTEAGSATSNSLTQTLEGFAFQNNGLLRLDIDDYPLANISGVVLDSTEGGKTFVIGGEEEAAVKEIVSIIPTTETNTLSGEFYSIIKLTPIDDTASPIVVRSSEEAGAVIQHLTKLAFPTAVSVGIDGYHYSGGLIEETARVLYGDESDIFTYPGVISGGNSIEISGPLVKRIRINLSLRLRAGLPVSSVTAKVKSAVASVINQTKIGDDISLSDIVEAANRVSGVLSVTIDFPTYNNLNDVIVVQEYEKPLVLDIVNDIQISIIGS